MAPARRGRYERGQPRTIDRYDTTFDHNGLIANAGLLVIATLMSRLGPERLTNRWVHTGSFAPGR